jgi:integrase
MPRRRDQPGRIGEYWLSRRPNSPMWCRTWFDQATGQTRRESLGTEDFELAHQRLVQWVAAHVFTRSDARTARLSDVFLQYWQHHASKLPSAPTAKLALRHVLEIVDGDPVIAEFGPRAQQRLIEELKRRYPHPSGYAKRIFGVFKAAVVWAWRNEVVSDHPPFADPPPEGEGRDRIMNIEELAALMDAAYGHEHLRAFIMTALSTLCRPEAALQLTRGQCDLERGIIDLNPPGRERNKKRRPVVPMPNAIRPWVQAAGRWIVEYQGRPIADIRHRFAKARDLAGLDAGVVPYALRHTMATMLAERGVPELEIAAVMGHRMPNIKTTGRYVKFRPEYLSNARDAIDSVVNEMGRLAGRPIEPETHVRASNVLTLSSKARENLGATGAGEAIRTPDPHLGKVMLYP